MLGMFRIQKVNADQFCVDMLIERQIQFYDHFATSEEKNC